MTRAVGYYRLREEWGRGGADNKTDLFCGQYSSRAEKSREMEKRVPEAGRRLMWENK